MITRSFTNSRNETHFIERNTNATIITMILMIDSINFHSCPKWSYLFWTIVHAGIDELCIWYYNVHVSKLMSCQDFLFRLYQSESLPIYNLLRFCKIGTAHQTGFFFSRFLLDSVKSISWSAFYFKRGTYEFYVNDLFPQGLK